MLCVRYRRRIICERHPVVAGRVHQRCKWQPAVLRRPGRAGRLNAGGAGASAPSSTAEMIDRGAASAPCAESEDQGSVGTPCDGSGDWLCHCFNRMGGADGEPCMVDQGRIFDPYLPLTQLNWFQIVCWALTLLCSRSWGHQHRRRH